MNESFFLQKKQFNGLRLQKTATQYLIAQSAGAVEYTDCFSAEG